jgi:hypothetical protein
VGAHNATGNGSGGAPKLFDSPLELPARAASVALRSYSCFRDAYRNTAYLKTLETLLMLHALVYAAASTAGRS